MNESPLLNPRQERLPASNIDAECEIIGAILLDPGATDRISSKLPPEAMSIRANRVIYQAALRIRKERRVVDLLSIATTLKESGELENAGGKANLANLLDGAITSANIDQHAELVREKYVRREMARIGSEIIRHSQTCQSLDGAISASQASYNELLSLASTSEDDVKHIGDLMIEVYSQALERADGKAVAGISTGFYDVDSMIGGVVPGDLCIIAARPSMGKTSWVMNVADNLAQKGNGAFVASMEMAQIQIALRLLSSNIEIDSRRLAVGKLDSQQWEALGGSINRYSDRPLWVDGKNQSAAEIGVKVQRLKSEGHQIDMIMVDFLQLMGGNANRVQELDYICRQFKQIARELNVGVWLLSQLSRGVESRTNKRPMMSDLRESGGIEQIADQVLMMYREDYYDPDTPDKGIAEVIVSKNRNGPTGTTKLLFEPQYTRFRNLAPRLNE